VRLGRISGAWRRVKPCRSLDSLLYQVVASELETFLASQQDNERHVPGFVERDFRSFLDCGVLARVSWVQGPDNHGFDLPGGGLIILQHADTPGESISSASA
jgi:hypothetical protein